MLAMRFVDTDADEDGKINATEFDGLCEDVASLPRRFACWCETNGKGKTASIADAETRIKDLTVQIEELSAASSRFNTQIKNLDMKVAESQAVFGLLHRHPPEGAR